VGGSTEILCQLINLQLDKSEQEENFINNSANVSSRTIYLGSRIVMKTDYGEKNEKEQEKKIEFNH
jgi:hypothetical protein